MKLNFTCLTCKAQFERNICPSSKIQVRTFCSRSCQMKKMRNSPETGIKTLICYFCHAEYKKYVKARQSGLNYQYLTDKDLTRTKQTGQT